MYEFALSHEAAGGKICGAGGGGAFIFFAEKPEQLKDELKLEFPNCFEIDFDFELNNVKILNHL
jgi:galactokinase/mevalonate kinase-like predicted kinase